jgi:hypothetical protein
MSEISRERVSSHIAAMKEALIDPHQQAEEREGGSLFLLHATEYPGAKSYVGVDPMSMKTSDLVCLFKDSETALILRQLSRCGDIGIIARTVLLVQDVNADYSYGDYPPPSFDEFKPFEGHNSSIDLTLDTVVLQALTCLIPWRKPEFKFQDLL